MKTVTPPPPEDNSEEIAALIEILQNTSQRLEQLTGGEVDAVANRDGKTFLLQHAQEQLRLNESARQAAILNALPASIALLDSQGKILSVNEAWQQFGRANAAHSMGHDVGANYLTVCDKARGDDAAEASQAAAGIRAVLDGKVSTYTLEYPCHSPTEQRWFLMMVSPLSDRQPNGAVVMHIDVTAERQSKESLKLSETRFQQMADNITDVFWVTSPDLKIMHYVSPGYQSIWGRSMESLYANPHQWMETILPEERLRVSAIFATLMGSEPKVSVEYPIARPDGTVRWVHDRGFQVRDGAGNLVRLTGIVTDITERKMVQETLQRQQTELRVLFDLMPAMIWFKDTENRILRVNQRVSEAAGKPVEEIEGKPSQEIYPQNAAKYFADDLEVIGSGVPKLGIIETLPGQDGEPLWVQTDKVPYRDKDGKVIGIVVMAQDITERKRAQDAVARSQRHLRAVIDGVGPSMFVGLLTADGIMIEVNKPPLVAAGLNLDDVLGKRFDQTHWWSNSPEAQQQLREAMRRAAHGEASRFDVRTRGVGDEFIDFDFTLQPLKDETGKVVFMVPSASVITERKQVEQALRTSMEEFHTLAEAMPQIVWITNAEGQNIYFNQHWVEYTGLTLEESLGDGWNKPFHPDDRQQALDAWQTATTTIGVYSIETRLRRSDGVYRWWLVRAVPLKGADGNILKWFGTCTDIHDMKMAALEIARANGELLESERRFTDLLGNVELVSMMLDHEARVTYCNDYLLRLTGWQRDEVIGKNWWEIFMPPELNNLKVDVFAKLLDDQPEARHHENEILTRTGERRLIRWNNSVLRSSTGDVTGMASLGEDITESKRSQQAILREQDIIKSILNSLPGLFYFIDSQGRFLRWNDNFQIVSGYSFEEVSNMIPTDFFAESDRKFISDRINMVFKSGEANAEVDFLSKENVRTPYFLTGKLIQIDQKPCLIGMGIDITERRLADARIIYLNRVYAMQSGINSLIVHEHDRDELFREACRIVVDVGGFRMAMIGIVNPDEMKIFPVASVGKDETLLKAITNILSSDELASNTMVARAIRENRVIVSNDSQNDPQVMFGKLYAEAGVNSMIILPLMLTDEVFGAFAIYASESNFFHDEEQKLLSTLAGDISFALEYMKAQDALRNLNEELETKVSTRTADLDKLRIEAEHANRAKSDFLATMSHEIRTPMNGVIGMVDVLQQSSLNAEQMEMTRIIHDSAYALLTIIDDVLDFSKIEANKLHIESVAMSVADVMEGVCATLDNMAEKKGVELMMFADPGIPDVVLGDPVRLRQILVNLISNAIKFSSGQLQRGKVSVRAQLFQHSPAQIGLLFQVIDNGIGIDVASQARLFIPFTQADSTTTRLYGGTGLGLVISRHLATSMGGDISLQSELGQGSVFSVRLPFELLADNAADYPQPLRQTQDSVSQLVSVIPESVAGLHCLVVGDTGGLADDVAVYLKHAGTQVERMTDMETANAWFASRPVGLSIVIIDNAANKPEFQMSSIDSLRDSARAHSKCKIHFVIIGRGKRREPRLKDSDLVILDGNVLSRNSLLKAVAIAAGRTGEFGNVVAGDAKTKQTLLSHEEARLQGRLILVIEDNEINQKVILQQLRLLGEACDIVSNGREGLDWWKGGGYGLLLTDLHMPVMDGYELTAAIRASERVNNTAAMFRTPIIAITANALKGEADHCREVGMDDYLSKPVELVKLKAMLDKWLPCVSAATISAETLLSSSAHSVAPIAVDVNVLKALVGDDDEVVREFLSYFRISVTAMAVELRAVSEAKQATAAGLIAHKLKSSARAVGALALADLCTEMEKSGQAGDSVAINAQLLLFEKELKNVEDYLEEY